MWNVNKKEKAIKYLKKYKNLVKSFFDGDVKMCKKYLNKMFSM